MASNSNVQSKKTISLTFDDFNNNRQPAPTQDVEIIDLTLGNSNSPAVQERRMKDYEDVIFVSEVKPKSTNPKVLSLNMNIFSPSISANSQVQDSNASKNIHLSEHNYCAQLPAPGPVPGPSHLSFPPKISSNNNPEEFVCSLCLTFVPAGVGVLLKECKHTFCKQCLRISIFNDHDRSGAVLCPLKIENCDKPIAEKDIKEFLGATDYKVFLSEVSRKAKESDQNEEALLPTLLGMEDVPIIQNFKAFDCPICFENILPGNGLILKNCLHTFCKECIIGHVQAADEYLVPCPFTENNRPCDEEIRESEIRHIVPENVFKKHLEKSIKLAEGMSEKSFHCRTADCQYFAEIDDPNMLHFRCEVCKKLNCIKCKAQHEGKTCIEYQEDINPDAREQRLRREQKESEEAILAMITAGTAMLCPRCDIPVQKITGCDFIVCTTCKLGICWVTKKPRNDLMKDGRLILGCGCKIDGKKCHPKCGNCH